MTVQEETTSASGELSVLPRYDAAVEGFPNYWYPVLFSRDLKRKPRAIKLLGQQIALFRESGTVYALHDRCPHRGVPLSCGRWEVPGTISCAYHGWTYELSTGELIAVLTDGPDSPIVGKANVRVRTYPVEERAGLIWVYVGDKEPCPVETDIPPELLAKDAVIQGCIFHDREGNWRYAAENGYDEGHAKYLHRTVLWSTFRKMPAWSKVHIETVKDAVEGSGEWIVRVTDDLAFQSDYPGIGKWPRRVGFYKTTKLGAKGISIRMPGQLRLDRGFGAYEFYVPVDATHYRIVLLAVQWGTGLKKLLWKLRYRTYIRRLYHGQFNGQDDWMIKMLSCPPERLYRPDKSITSWRKLCEQEPRNLEEWTRGEGARRVEPGPLGSGRLSAERRVRTPAQDQI